jgi:hypothetical protein
MTTQSNQRVPAYPLVVNDPYLSVWSTHDRLTDGWSSHWTGKEQALCGIIRIDGEAHRFIGGQPRYFGRPLPPMAQTAVTVLPTRTIYTFAQAGVQLQLTFTTPLLPHDLDHMAWPVTYLDLQVQSNDGRPHQVELYIDVGASLVVNTPEQAVVWGRHRLGEREVLWLGSQEQPLLKKAGDDLRIDWGYLYLATPQTDAGGALGGDTTLRRYFADHGALPAIDDFDMPRAVGIRPPSTVAAWTFALGAVTAEPQTATVVLAYDDQFSVEYMHRKLRPYWRRNGMAAPGLLTAALAEHDELTARCAAYDEELMADLRVAGGDGYAQLAALAFRQCIAAHKLVAELDGTPLFFSKENFSNGCMGTVDITYPTSPFFLLLNPALLEAQLTPVFDYAQSSRWPFPFAPHDVGRYPLANGQVYGGGATSDIDQMPVEECGNLLLLTAALCKVQGSLDYAQRYWPTLRQWASYLLDKGLDPEEQLCTDDFAGHLAHNVNLSLKALLGIAAYGQLCEQAGLTDEAAQIRQQAEVMAQQWQTMAFDQTNGDHYRLAFDRPGTWSQKYNLVWDRLLDLNLFPATVAQTEIAFYRANQDQYGLPLDNRSTYTKLDWIIWSACLAEDDAIFAEFIAPLDRWLVATESRVPLTDWYYTDSGKQRGFQARAVVGGVYIKLLYDNALWQKWLAKAA